MILGRIFFFEFPGLDCQKVELGAVSELTMDSQDWEIIPWWSTSMHGCRSIIMIFTRYRRCPSTSLRKNNSPLGWIDSDICFACLREKAKYRCDVTDAFTCAQKLTAVLPCMLKDRDEESFWKTGSPPARDILSLVTSSEP